MKKVFFLIFLLGSMVVPGLAQNQKAPPPKTPPPAEKPLPGVAEVVPRSSAVVDESGKAQTKIASLADISDLESRLKTIKENQRELDDRIARLGKPENWSSDRLLENRGRLSDQQDALKKLLADLSSRLQELDGIRQDWTARRQFWKKWQKSLEPAQVKATRDAFTQADDSIAKVLESASKAAAPLVPMQKEVGDLQNRNQEVIGKIDSALETLRRETFKKTGPSFANPRFYRQFNARLWQEVRAGVADVQGVGRAFFQDQGWILALQIALVLGLAGLVLRHRHRQEETREWQFLLHHPWAVGIFVAVAALSFLYSSPPGLWRLGIRVLAAVSAAVLISALLKNPRKIFMVKLLVALFILSSALQVISFPLPPYRLYLAVISLLGAPLLMFLAIRNQRARGVEGRGFTLALKVGAGIFLVSLFAQCLGFIALSSRLIESSLNSVFLGLFAAMAVRLGQGGIDYLLDREIFRNRPFFQRFGDELTFRLKRIFQILIVVYAVLYLLEIWGLYDSVWQAWESILGFGVTVGKNSITVRMVLFSGLVLYAAMVFSWAVRSLLEAEFFPGRKFDRGVRDSIKKLLHYSFIFLGFLLAMSLAGVELKNFAVLAGAFGIGIGFGLQNIVNNFVSGLILLFERPIKVGDLVVLDSVWGSVRKIGLRSTVVTTVEESEIIVPNSMLVSEKVTNWSLTSSLCRVSVPVGVAYGSDVPLVLKILSEAGDHVADIMASPPSSPLFKGFGDSSLDFELRVWISDVKDRLTVQSDICRYIDDRFRAEGIEIPFPQRDLHLRSAAKGLFGESGQGGGGSP